MVLPTSPDISTANNATTSSALRWMPVLSPSAGTCRGLSATVLLAVGDDGGALLGLAVGCCAAEECTALLDAPRLGWPVPAGPLLTGGTTTGAALELAAGWWLAGAELVAGAGWECDGLECDGLGVGLPCVLEFYVGTGVSVSVGCGSTASQLSRR